jgi:hypothetical protein
MKMSLHEWLKFGWLREHKTSRQEIAELFAVADRDLNACRTPNLVADWQFNISYNAALQLSSAALAAAGFQAERANHHFRVIHSLEFTLGLDSATIGKFDVFRKKRNVADYQRADTVSETEAEEMRQLAEDLRVRVEAWIRTKYPKFAS